MEKLEKYLPYRLYRSLPEQTSDMLEIRLRVGRQVLIRYPTAAKEIEISVTPELLSETLQLFCGHSLYAYAGDIAKGFVTVGGMRVGIGGKVIFSNGESRGISTVSSLNIRFSREVKGCADKLLPYIKTEKINSVLISSPPMCGKTTILRDALRQLSDSGINTAVIDERCEIACLDINGIPTNDVGKCTDVLSGCGKQTGVMMALRSLTPEIIALDEIGEKSDVQAINRAVTGGAALICTVHSDSFDSLKNKKYISPLIEDRLFDRIVFLKGLGEIAEVRDRWGERLC